MSFQSHLQKLNLKNSSIHYYLQIIQVYEDWLASQMIPIQDSTTTDILSYLQERRSTHVQNRHLATILRIIQRYYHYHGIDPNPAATITIHNLNRPPAPEMLSQLPLEHIYELHPQASFIQLKRKIILGLLIFQAAETMEIKQLRRQDFDTHLSKVHLPGVRCQARKLLLNPLQKQPLTTYLETQQAELFPDSRSQYHKHLAALRKHCAELEPQVQKLFQLRASRIRIWIRQTNLREAQYKAGHKYISSTERYEGQSLEDLRTAIDHHHKA